MRLTGLHFLVTYQCNLECDHCFVWGGPQQSGVFTIGQISYVLRQAKDLGGITSIYFEGGEPFLYYPVLARGVKEAAALGFDVGIVSNAYWATSVEDAREWLRPFAGLVQDLSVSSDLYHSEETLSRQARNATQAAQDLGIPVGAISIAQPDQLDRVGAVGQLPQDETAVMYRGRAAAKLASRAVLYPWVRFDACPYEDLREPGRVHLDPFGYMHLCQGISIGNLFQDPLGEICAGYRPDEHPIAGPLLAGGPAELVRRYDLPHGTAYADACHLCYLARQELRARFPHLLLPDQLYGVLNGN
jgi:hypothetical protein